MTISLVVAASINNVIGSDGGLPWHLPDDLRHFKRLTTGKPVVMGRRTFESIGRPLPGRRNIVITRNPDFSADGCDVVGDIDAALSHLALNGQRDAEAIRPVFADILTALMDLERTAPLLLLLTSEEFGQFGYFPNPAFRRRVR